MKSIIALISLALAMMAFPSGKAIGGDRVPVVVELFTLEGCSSYPPADALLASLSQQPIDAAQIITLSEHVDYWNQVSIPPAEPGALVCEPLKAAVWGR